jgi:hypothetical protein
VSTKCCVDENFSTKIFRPSAFRRTFLDQQHIYRYFYRDKEKLTFEIADLKQRAQDITFLKVTRSIQEYLACSDDAGFEIRKQQELQMLEATIDKMKQVCLI